MSEIANIMTDREKDVVALASKLEQFKLYATIGAVSIIAFLILVLGGLLVYDRKPKREKAHED